MKKLLIPAAAGAIALALASCGGSYSSGGGSSSSSSQAPARNVLVDASGMALYSPSGETASKVRCTGACVAIWKPVPPGAVKTAAGVKLGAITRPDGAKQATAAGKPLYTFVQDKPGAVTGNGASDAFGASHFTWHVVTTAGGTSAAAPASTGGGYGANSGY